MREKIVMKEKKTEAGEKNKTKRQRLGGKKMQGKEKNKRWNF